MNPEEQKKLMLKEHFKEKMFPFMNELLRILKTKQAILEYCLRPTVAAYDRNELTEEEFEETRAVIMDGIFEIFQKMERQALGEDILNSIDGI